MQDNSLTRICSCCGTAKPESCFYKHPSIRPDGVRKKCTDCRNNYRREANLANPEINRRRSNSWASKNRLRLAEEARIARKNNPRKFKGYYLKKAFGITIEQYDVMLLRQKGVCAICSRPETAKHQNGKIKYLSVDHCHTTGKVRALLCGLCNTGIGKLRHSPELLRKAANYVEEHS